MKQLLVIKERLKKFVGKNEVFILPVLKFVLTFMALSRINSSLGFMSRLTNGAITLIVALAGSFLPMNLTLVILALITIAHVYALSLECAIVVLVLFLVLFLLYFRFSAKDSVAVMLVPLSFVYKIPYVLPVSMGLIGEPTSMVSAGCGVVVYHVLHFISVNAADLKSDGKISLSMMGSFKELVDQIINNKAMLVLTVAFAATVLVVYVIRRLSIPYCWAIAIVAGTMADFIIVLVGNSATKAGISAGGAFLGMIVSIIFNIILQYFCFDLDYNRTEKLQFEDDEYYYYVKAVPKNTIKLSDNGNKRKRPAPAGQVRRPQTQRPQSHTPQARTPRVSDETTVLRKGAAGADSNARQTVRNTAANAAKTRVSQGTHKD